MITKTTDFKGLDKLIAEYKENLPVKKGLLVIKSQCTPYKDKTEGIPKRVVVKIANQLKTGEEFLAGSFADDDDNDMFEYHSGIANAAGMNLVRIIFPEEETED